MIMGAIWDFLSGKSTDWDEFEAQEAERTRKQLEWEAAHPEAKKKRYKAYCRICGVSTHSTFSSPGSAVASLQNSGNGYDRSLGCGARNHSPEIQEVYE